jgi:DNA primase catalytic core
MNDIEKIYDILLGQDYSRRLFSGLSKMKKTSSGYLACCPFHEDNNPSFSISTSKPVWNCFAGCGSGDWIQYLQKRDGKSIKEAIEYLAQAAGYTLGNINDSPTLSREIIVSSAMETIHVFCTKLLFEQEGSSTLNYLINRGYSTDAIRSMELGYFPAYEVVHQYLLTRGFSEETIQECGFRTSGLGTTHTITIPYRDRVGRMKGFIVRSYDDAVQPKYKFTYGTEKDTLFNLHIAKSSDRIIVVEGFLDALYATELGISGVVALGQAQVSEKQIENLGKLTTAAIILALDDDTAGRVGTERSVPLFSKSTSRIYVIPSFQSFKDPDELLRTSGKAAFEECIKQTIPAPVWMIERILSKHDYSTQMSIDSAKKEALSYLLYLTDSRYITLVKKTIFQQFDLDEADFEREIIHFQKINNREEAYRKYKKLISQSSVLLKDDNLEELDLYLRETLPQLRIEVASVPASYSFDEFITDIKLSQTGLKTGYKELDEYITIKPGTITILAGRPRHGKTTLMINLILNLVKLNPSKSFLFFSYEESRKDIAVKILANLSEDIVNQHQNITNVEYYLRGNSVRDKIEAGKRQLQEYLDSGRLQIFDSSCTVDELSDIIQIHTENGTIGAVFVDYIQKIKILGRFPSRQVELQKVSERILEAAKRCAVPILLGAQLNRDTINRTRPKLENLRESGDIENDANTVIAIYNESVENSDNEQNYTNDSGEVDFELSILKNRNGLSNKTIKLKFNRPILKIT